MFEYALYIYLVVALGMFLIGMSKGGMGATLGALAVPLMALVLPTKGVIGMMPPILMLADLLAVSAHWKRWDNRLVWLLVPASVVGVGIGTFFLASAPVDVIRVSMGVIVLLLAGYKLLEGRVFKRMTYTPRTWHGLLAGSVAGFTSSVAHNGGPPISIYLLMQNLQPRVFAATSAIFFLILNYIKVPFYLFAGVFDFELLWDFLWLVPLVPLGVWAGKWLVVRVSKELYDTVILLLLVVTALMLIFT